jgi:L-ascorbate metabolism protein UlaG (beta-lactamase superfamily)
VLSEVSSWVGDPFGRRDRDDAVKIRWLGTAGFAIESAGTTLLIDPYVTRASLSRCVVAPLWSDERAVREYVPRADAIVVGHTHFDHVLDVPSIARITGAKVFGSRSCVSLCRAANIAESQLRDVESEALMRDVVAEVGPFRLTFVPSVHANILLGKVPFPGDIADCDHIPLRAEAYRCGAVFSLQIDVAGQRIFHLGSANLVESTLAPREVDLLLLCVAGWTTTERFTTRVMRALSPRRVLLSHWDNFLRPMQEGAHALPAMRVPRLIEGLRAESRDLSVGALPLLGDLWV